MLAWAGAGVAGLAGVAGFLHLALRKRTRSGGHLAFGPAGMAKRRKQADEGNGSAFLPVAGKALPPCPAGPSASQSKEEMSFPLLQLVGQPLMLDICKVLLLPRKHPAITLQTRGGCFLPSPLPSLLAGEAPLLTSLRIPCSTSPQRTSPVCNLAAASSSSASMAKRQRGGWCRAGTGTILSLSTAWET